MDRKNELKRFGKKNVLPKIVIIALCIALVVSAIFVTAVSIRKTRYEALDTIPVNIEFETSLLKYENYMWFSITPKKMQNIPLLITIEDLAGNVAYAQYFPIMKKDFVYNQKIYYPSIFDTENATFKIYRIEQK